MSAAYIEAIHDVGIGFAWPGLEPVHAYDCKDLNQLASVGVGPYGAGFGIEYYPTLFNKAAYIFFHLCTAHMFHNGNKRTALLATDQFLLANGKYLALPNKAFYELTVWVADSTERGDVTHETMMRTLTKRFRTFSVPFGYLKTTYPHSYAQATTNRLKIRDDILNAAGACPKQARRDGYSISHETA